MLLTFINQRVNNFNLCLVLVGGISAALINVKDAPVIVLLCLSLAFSSIVFWWLDGRVSRLILDAREDLCLIEPYFGISIHKKDPAPYLASRRRGKWRSHTYVYRAVFLFLALLALVCLTATLAGIYPVQPTTELSAGQLTALFAGS
jgi:hypothetical protein